MHTQQQQSSTSEMISLASHWHLVAAGHLAQPFAAGWQPLNHSITDVNGSKPIWFQACNEPVTQNAFAKSVPTPESDSAHTCCLERPCLPARQGSRVCRWCMGPHARLATPNIGGKQSCSGSNKTAATHTAASDQHISSSCNQSLKCTNHGVALQNWQGM